MSLFHVFIFLQEIAPKPVTCTSLLLFLFLRHKIDENKLREIKEMDSGLSLPEQIHSMNAYIG